MMTPLRFLKLIFRPDLLDEEQSTEDTEDQRLVREAANIFDCTEEVIVESVGRRAGVKTDMDDFYRTGKLPPMALQWLRQNMPSHD